MEIGDTAWQQRIINGAGELGVTVQREQADLFACHAIELTRWNRKLNLTRITDPEEIAIKHVVDSLAAVPMIPERGTVLDIGSGGGFPGLPLKVMRPGTDFTLIDSVRKKISFLNQVIRLMSLKKIRARHIRAEHLRPPEGEGPRFDRIVCRALADMARIIEWALPLLATGGCIILLKGHLSGEEIAKAKPLLAQHQLEYNPKTYRLPFDASQRTLITLWHRA